MYPPFDDLFEEIHITKVQRLNKTWVITRPDGWSFGYPVEDSRLTPKAGMLARFYGRGPNLEVRGLFFDGVEVFYRPPEIEARLLP